MRAAPALALFFATGAAGADDGVHGRFDGDLDLGLGLGAQQDSSGTYVALRAEASVFSMAGLSVGLEQATVEAQRILRRVDASVQLRPLFIPRWALDAQRGGPFADLFLDSITLGLGLSVAEPRGGRFGAERALEPWLGLGAPLGGAAAGPWLRARGGARLPDAVEPRPAAGFVELTLAWHTALLSPWAAADATRGTEP